MSHEEMGGTRVAGLQAAFRVFTSATVTFEAQYRLLQARVEELRRELDAKQRALAASIERQRCLEEQALRQGRLAAMGEMAATLAHEVRNPLGAMELCVRLLADEVRDRPVARRLAEQIDVAIGDMDHFVTNILDYTRLPEPSRSAVELDDLIREALAVAAPGLGPAVRVEHEPASGTVWSLDRGLVTQVLVNLFRNAAEAMRGSGTLTVRVEPGPRWVRILVADTGPGVPPGSEETIFQPFFTTKGRGTGLGLAVARAATAAHGGTLALRPGTGGAVFVITLPAAAPRPAVAAQRPAQEGESWSTF